LLEEVDGLMQMPDSPNLYWALTALPDPMIDTHSSLENEREVLFVEFPQLRNLESEVLSPAQASAIASDFMKKIQTLGGGMDDAPFRGLFSVGWVMVHYSDAKEFLARKGYSQERIEMLPAAQAVLIYQKQEYLEMLDNLFKWFEIPYSQAQSRLKKGEQQIDEHQRNKGIKVPTITAMTIFPMRANPKMSPRNGFPCQRYTPKPAIAPTAVPWMIPVRICL